MAGAAAVRQRGLAAGPAQPAEGAPGQPSAEEQSRRLQEYRREWEPSGGVLKRSARRAHKFLWWLMCFTGLDVLDHHERVLFALGYIAVLGLVLLGAGKQLQALLELWRDVVKQQRGRVNGS